MINIFINTDNFKYYESSLTNTLTLKKINFIIDYNSKKFITIFLTNNKNKLEYYYGT